MPVIGNQIKAARALVGWNQFALAAASGIGVNTIRRLEGYGAAPVGGYAITLQKIQDALRWQRVELISEPGIGVRLLGPPEQQQGQSLIGSPRDHPSAAPPSSAGQPLGLDTQNLA